LRRKGRLPGARKNARQKFILAEVFEPVVTLAMSRLTVAMRELRFCLNSSMGYFLL
jgi:hypothetical protein